MSSNPTNFDHPTPDDLGGVPVVADCPEVTTIRPRRPYVKVPANLPDPNARPTLDDLSGIPVGFTDDEPPGRTVTTAQPDGQPGG